MIVTVVLVIAAVIIDRYVQDRMIPDDDGRSEHGYTSMIQGTQVCFSDIGWQSYGGQTYTHWHQERDGTVHVSNSWDDTI